jgi:hypothetical protein
MPAAIARPLVPLGADVLRDLLPHCRLTDHLQYLPQPIGILKKPLDQLPAYVDTRLRHRPVSWFES